MYLTYRQQQPLVRPVPISSPVLCIKALIVSAHSSPTQFKIRSATIADTIKALLLTQHEQLFLKTRSLFSQQ